MKLTLLGTGTPWPSIDRQCTANLVQTETTNILFDAGRGVTTQLARIGMHPRDVDLIFITHHHFDHIGNLDDLLLAAWNDGRTRPVQVYGPPGTGAIIDHLFNGIYLRDIVFRLKEAAVAGRDMPDIREVVQTTDILPGEGFDGSGLSVRAQSVEHGHALGLSHVDWPCYGYRLEAGGKVLTISGDTIDCAGVRALAADADLLLQCCYLAEAEVNTTEKRMLADLVLASAVQAGNIARAAAVKKMVLTHLSPKSDAMLVQVLNEASKDTGIEVVIGADLMSFDI